MTISTRNISEVRSEFLELGKRLTSRYGFMPDRTVVHEVCALFSDIELFHATQQQKWDKGRQQKQNQPKEGGGETREPCPIRGPGKMTCQECRSYQQLFDRIHAIEDTLICHGLIEREEDHQLHQVSCGTADYVYSHIRITIRDPMFEHLNIMEWFSPPGYTWVTVMGMFFAPFLTEEEWYEDD